MLKFTKDSFVQNLARGQMVVPYLEKFDEYDETWTFTYEPKKKDDGWHPSGHCTPTVMELYKIATGAAGEKHRPSAQRNFIVGHFWHALIQHVLCNKLGFCEPDAIERKGAKAWGVDHTEFNVLTQSFKEIPKPYHWATGSGDIVPLVLPNDWRGVFDIKTMAGAMYRAAWKSGLLPPAFAAKYECQVNIYMDFFNEDRALILGVNKDNPHGFVEFEFERNQDLIDAIYAKWLYVSTLLDLYNSGEEPTEDDLAVEFPLPLTGPIR